MQKKNQGKYAGRIALVLVFVLIALAVAAIFLLWLGIGTNVFQGSGAMIAGAWQNLFGGASYDVSPGDDAVFDDEDASGTAIAAASSSFNASSSDSEGFSAHAAAAAKKTTKNVVSSKKSSTSTVISRSSADDADGAATSSRNDNTTQNVSPIPAPASSNTPSSGTVHAIPQPLCAFPVSSSSPSQKVILNEIAWMGSPSSTGDGATAAADDEWIELKNISPFDIDLAGWSLTSASGAMA